MRLGGEGAAGATSTSDSVTQVVRTRMIEHAIQEAVAWPVHGCMQVCVSEEERTGMARPIGIGETGYVCFYV